MPGDREADQPLTLVISVLLNTLRTQLLMEGIEAAIPHVHPHKAMLSARRAALVTWNLDVSYVDDIALAIPVRADKAINTLRRTVLVLRRVVRQFRLPLNFSAEKPKLWWMPLVLVLALYAWLSGTRTHAMLNALMSMALRPFVSVAPTSSWAALLLCRQNMSPEVRARTSTANRALGTTRAPVLSAQDIERLIKKAALSSFVLSRFSYLTPTWPKLKCRCARWKALTAILLVLPVVPLSRRCSCQEHRTDALQSSPDPLADRDGCGSPPAPSQTPDGCSHCPTHSSGCESFMA